MPTFGSAPITTEALRLIAAQLEFLQFVKDNKGMQSIVTDLANQREQLDADRAAVAAGQSSLLVRERDVAAEELRLADLRQTLEGALATARANEADRLDAAQAAKQQLERTQLAQAEFEAAVALRDQSDLQREINVGEREAACAKREADLAAAEADVAATKQRLAAALNEG